MLEACVKPGSWGSGWRSPAAVSGYRSLVDENDNSSHQENAENSPKSDGDKELNLNSVLPCPRISVTAQFWNPFFISSSSFMYFL